MVTMDTTYYKHPRLQASAETGGDILQDSKCKSTS